MDRLHIEKLIIVEGRYDKIRLENIVDAPVIAVNGFKVYKDKKLRETLKSLSKNGAIILTDSDRAGYKIRVFLSEILNGCEITDVFVPQISGKERRKKTQSAEGYLGVEGIPDGILYNCLAKYCTPEEQKGGITVSDLYELGYTGSEGSREKKRALLRYLGVQDGISNRFLLRILNGKFTKRELADLKLDME